MQRARLLCLLWVSVFDVSLSAEPPSGFRRNVVTFDRPPLFQYGSWEESANFREGHLFVDESAGATSHGGLGFNEVIDLSSHPDDTLAIRVQVGAANEMTGLRWMAVTSDDRQLIWNFTLPSPSSDWQWVVADEYAAVARPNDGNADGLVSNDELAFIGQWQLTGNYGIEVPAAVEIDAVALIAINDEIRRGRQASSMAAEQEKNTQRQRRQRLMQQHG